MSCLRTQHNVPSQGLNPDQLLSQESSALTMRPPCLYNLIFFSLKKLRGPEGGPEGRSRFSLQPNDTAPEMIVTVIIIYMKKLLDSDWLRAVQFKCNTSANYTS